MRTVDELTLRFVAIAVPMMIALCILIGTAIALS